ncbi:hypothetical protein APY94_01515 [Thermococcus celericrescens]|uniref:Uncharacterized protein n=1 Tax=Thermococcus celericrescens TaxID=227598 RepID=A0A117ITX4_9EURY|nr:hypothetical protein [Thermococcus celericrescens]KUH34524.1 hypothetical protein APY94_01515 [Thermococcus celericrescens]
MILKLSLLGTGIAFGLFLRGSIPPAVGILLTSLFGLYSILGSSAPGIEVPCDPREDMGTYNPKLI